jgi:NAD(P) transhydrogenase subunit alpha
MTDPMFTNLALFVLSLLVGFEVISKIPSTLHTPMMSGANAIHGVVVAGAVIIAAMADSPTGYVLTGIAAAFAAANVVGGYVVTDRMLQMFRKPDRTDPHTTGITASTDTPGAATATSSTAPTTKDTNK